MKMFLYTSFFSSNNDVFVKALKLTFSHILIVSFDEMRIIIYYSAIIILIIMIIFACIYTYNNAFNFEEFYCRDDEVVVIDDFIFKSSEL